jgi:hypothetical protein
MLCQVAGLVSAARRNELWIEIRETNSPMITPSRKSDDSMAYEFHDTAHIDKRARARSFSGEQSLKPRPHEQK